MPDYLYIPLQVYLLGFIISMFMALLIKVLLFTIRHFAKNDNHEE